MPIHHITYIYLTNSNFCSLFKNIFWIFKANSIIFKNSSNSNDDHVTYPKFWCDCIYLHCNKMGNYSSSKIETPILTILYVSYIYNEIYTNQRHQYVNKREQKTPLVSKFNLKTLCIHIMVCSLKKKYDFFQ